MMKLRHSPLSIAAGPIWLEAMQAHSPDAPGLILVAQTTVGHHRDSREAHFVQRLQKAGYATLLFDLLTRYEENRDPDTRYIAPLLGTRIGAVFEWLRHQPPLVIEHQHPEPPAQHDDGLGLVGVEVTMGPHVGAGLHRHQHPMRRRLRAVMQVVMGPQTRGRTGPGAEFVEECGVEKEIGHGWVGVGSGKWGVGGAGSMGVTLGRAAEGRWRSRVGVRLG